jgi:hypothetical protein
MSPVRTSLFSALGRAAHFTIRGAAITFGSTLVSCGAACYIERGAHRLIYHYCPEKYANVEWANGLTQDQLDAVRRPAVHTIDGDEKNTSSGQKEEQMVGDMLWDAAEVVAAATTTTQPLHQESTSRSVDESSTPTQTAALTSKSNNNRNIAIPSSSSSTSTTRFWTDLEQQQQAAEDSFVRRLVPTLVSMNEIQSCAMTG